MNDVSLEVTGGVVWRAALWQARALARVRPDAKVVALGAIRCAAGA